MSVTIKVPSVASGVRTAVERFLAVAGLTESLSQDDQNRFSVTTANGTFLGVRPILSSVAAIKPQEVLGTDAEGRVSINQWVSTALQVSANAITLAEIEPLVSSKGQPIAGTKAATAADLFLYCAAASDILANAKTFPNLNAWVRNVEGSELIAPVKVAAPVASAEAEGAQKGKKEKGGSAFVRPSDEQIAAKRAEKEAAKAAKEAAKAAGKDAEEGEKKKKAPEGKEVKKTAKKAVNPADLDIRIGKMVDVKNHPESDKLLVEQIELGDQDGPRTIASGLAQYYKPEELIGCHCLVLCNMKPRSIAGVSSNGMVLCAKKDDIVSLITAPDAPPASRVVIGTSEVPAVHPPIPSAKQMEELVKHFTTDDKGTVYWQDKLLLVNGQTELTSKVTGAVVN